eukprot:m.133982 g.133982  ORF g.133982 m.133982 type:complete len:228 (-) comp14683_c0_seq1:1433-2116(-)
MASKQAVNFRRVLQRCEKIASSNIPEPQREKLLMLAESLEQQIPALEAEKLPGDIVNDYRSRLVSLKSKLESLEIATEDDDTESQQISAEENDKKLSNDSRNSKTSNIVRRKRTVGHDREQLLAGSEDSSASKHLAETHDKMTSDIAEMAEELVNVAKKQSTRIKEDIQAAEKLNLKASKANTKLGDVNDKLADQIKRSGGCGLWLMLLFVSFTFFMMIFFIKITNG